MKLQRPTEAFKPIVISIETRDEALRLAAAVLGCSSSDDTRMLERHGHLNVGAMNAPMTFSNLIVDALGVGRMSR